MQTSSLFSSEVCCPLIENTQLEINLLNTDGNVDSQRKFEISSFLCEDPDKLDKALCPNGPRKNLDKEPFPDTAGSGKRKKKRCVLTWNTRRKHFHTP